MDRHALPMATRRARTGRAITGLSAVALVDAFVVGLAQARRIRELPQPGWRAFDTMRVVRSPVAYPLGIPDGFLGALNHAANIALVALRGRSRHRRVLDRLLAASVAGGAIGAAYYAYQMAFRVRRLCPYCLVAIAIDFALVPLVVRDVAGGRVTPRGSAPPAGPAGATSGPR